jgi:putative flippase GtrA
VKFHLVALYGFLIQISVWNMILSATPEQFPAQEASYAANLVGILFATVNNYYLNKKFTWERNVDCA